MFLRNVFLAAFLAVSPGLAQSATVELTKGGDWTEFRFDLNRDGGAWLEPNANLGILSFTFSLAEAAVLQVTDAFRSGDRFQVFANNVALGYTSAPTTVGDFIDNDYTQALADDRWSSGAWDLDAGDYTITGFVDEMPEVRGRAAIRLVDASDVSAVPVPGSMGLLLGAGVAMGAVAARRKRKAARAAA